MADPNLRSQGSRDGSFFKRIAELIRSIPPGGRLTAVALLVVGLAVYLAMTRDRSDQQCGDVSVPGGVIMARGDNNNTSIVNCGRQGTPANP